MGIVECPSCGKTVAVQGSSGECSHCGVHLDGTLPLRGAVKPEGVTPGRSSRTACLIAGLTAALLLLGAMVFALVLTTR